MPFLVVKIKTFPVTIAFFFKLAYFTAQPSPIQVALSFCSLPCCPKKLILLCPWFCMYKTSDISEHFLTFCFFQNSVYYSVASSNQVLFIFFRLHNHPSDVSNVLRGLADKCTAS